MFSYSKIPFDDYEITSLSLRPSKPKVSVLVIAYNHEKYILECLLGLKSQILNFSYEYFITDDQSTDNTSKIVNNFVLNNPNFFHLLRNVNLGKYTKNGRYNLLHGLSVLRGQFIAICDGDDYWTDPYKLQKQVDYLEKKIQIVPYVHIGLKLRMNPSKLFTKMHLHPKTGKTQCLMKIFLLMKVSHLKVQHIIH